MMAAVVVAAALAQAAAALGGCHWLQGAPNWYKLAWVADTDAETATFTLTAATEGFVALGLSLDGTMISRRHGSDVWIGWVDGAGAGHVRDYVVELYDRPIFDEEYRTPGRQDLSLVAASEAGGATSVTFSRALATDQVGTDRTIRLDSELTFIWALASADPIESDAEQDIGRLFAKHDMGRGTFRVTLSEADGHECSQDPPEPAVGERHEFTSTDGSYRASWVVSEATGTIEVTMTALTIGWVGFGLTADVHQPRMIGSDVIIGWFDQDDGRGHLFDAFAATYDVPQLDMDRSSSDDVSLVSAEQIDGVTTIVFRRALSTGDAWSDEPITHAQMSLLWAYGLTDGKSDGASFQLDKHVDRGAVRVYFLAEGPEDDGSVVVVPEKELGGVTWQVVVHSTLMVVALGFLAPFAIFVSRYYRRTALFGIVGGEKASLHHMAMMILVVAMVLSGLMAVVVGAEHHHLGDLHPRLGLTVVALLGLQLMFGISLRCGGQEWARTPHRVVGAIAQVLAIATIQTGLHFMRASQATDILFWLAVFLAALALLHHERTGKASGYALASQMADDGDDQFQVEDPVAIAVAETRQRESRKCLGLIAALAIVVAMFAAAQSSDTFFREPAPLPEVSTNLLCDSCFDIVVRFDEFPVSTKDTSTYCHGYRLPGTGQFHMIAFEPIVDTEFVHHMGILRASNAHNSFFECETSVPRDASFMNLWALGGGPSFRMPPQTGFRGGAGTSTTAVLVQVHYINTARVSGAKDSSGFRIIATTDMRPYDAGVVFAGVSTRHINLPPGGLREVAGSCDTAQPANSAFAAAFHRSGYKALNVFAFGQHMHAHGRRIRGDRWRDGVREIWAEDTAYTYTKQAWVRRSTTWQLGDNVITHCQYDTTDDDENLHGGVHAHQEMCQLWIAFYPVLSEGACVPDQLYTGPLQGEWTPDPVDPW